MVNRASTGTLSMEEKTAQQKQNAKTLTRQLLNLTCEHVISCFLVKYLEVGFAV